MGVGVSRQCLVAFGGDRDCLCRLVVDDQAIVGEFWELVVVELNPLLSSLLGGDVGGWPVKKPDREFDREVPLGDGWVGATEYRADTSACRVRQ